MCVLDNLTVKNFRKSDNKDFSNHHYMVDVYLGDKLITQYHYNPLTIIFDSDNKTKLKLKHSINTSIMTYYPSGMKNIKDYFCLKLLSCLSLVYHRGIDLETIKKVANPYNCFGTKKLTSEFQSDFDKAIDNILINDKDLINAVLPDLKDVEFALVSDAECYESSSDFEDFCVNLGYDSNSRKAEKIYNACKDMWCILVKSGKYEEMKEVYQED